MRLASAAFVGLLVLAVTPPPKAEAIGEQWTVYRDPGWAGRDGAGLLPLGDYLYLLGGWEYGPTTSEVWRTRDLATWERLPDAPWPARHGAGWVVHDGRMWVVGGDLHADVWSSANGIDWRIEADDAPFGPRYTPNAASLDGSLIVYGGQSWADECWCTPVADSRVWGSSDGRSWAMIADAPWQPRGLIHGSIVHDGEIYLIGGGIKANLGDGGETVAERSDIWSSPDGALWTQRGEIPFAPRTHFSVLATDDGCYVSDGSIGTQANLSNELHFAADCLTFEPIDVPEQVGVRHASSLAWFDGALVILGGPDGRAGTDVWAFTP